MCGIVGLVTNYSNGFQFDEATAFQEMLVLDSFRGLDSTGVFGVDNRGNVEIMKEASHGLDFVMTQDFKNFRGKLIQRGMLAVGHNRAATKGTVNDKNAHPFWVDDKIILVQNGTVRGAHKHLAKGAADVEVDSEAIAHVLSEEPDIAKALQKVDSGYALVWFNTETKSLYLIRNSERPLYYVDGQNTGMLFASEDATLEYVIKKNKLKMKDIKELEPYNLMTIQLDKEVHYKRTIEKIDAAYVWRSAHGGGSFHQEYKQYEYSGYYGGMGYTSHSGEPDVRTPGVNVAEIDEQSVADAQEEIIRKTIPQATVHMGPRRHDFVPAGKTDLKVSMDDYAPHYLVEYHIDPMAVAGVLESVCQTKIEGKQFVELYDYIPANSHPECVVWHVVGSLVTARDDIPALVYWTVHNKTKEEITNYVADSFYEVIINRWDVSRFSDRYGIRRALVRGYGTQPKVCDGIIKKEVKADDPKNETVH